MNTTAVNFQQFDQYQLSDYIHKSFNTLKDGQYSAEHVSLFVKTISSILDQSPTSTNFSHSNVTALLHRVAKAIKKQPSIKNEFNISQTLAKIEDLILHKRFKGKFSVQDFREHCWSATRLALPQDHLIFIRTVLGLQPKKCAIADLATLFWSFAKASSSGKPTPRNLEFLQDIADECIYKKCYNAEPRHLNCLA